MAEDSKRFSELLGSAVMQTKDPRAASAAGPSITELRFL